MNFFAVTLLSLTLGQPGDPGYFPMTTRSLKLVIDYTPEERKNIRQVQLFASRDQGQTWTLEGSATPDKDFFPFVAPDDGMYWFNMMVIYNDGTRDPVDITRASDPQKLLIDATPPIVRILSANRAGDEILVNWSVEDRYLNPGALKLAYRRAAATDAEWVDVPLKNPEARSHRFNPNTNETILVRVTTEDLAGNPGLDSREIAGVSTSNSFVTPVEAVVTPAAPGTPESGAGSGIVAPTIDLVSAPPGNAISAPVQPMPVTPVTPAPVMEIPGASMPPPTLSPAAVDPVTPPAAAPAPRVEAPAAAPRDPFTAANAPQPIAMGSGTPPIATTTTPAAQPSTNTQPAELPRAQIINFTRFELPYNLEAGPSGIKHIDLYITRDDGQSWIKWSQHDGQEIPLRVNLENRLESRPDGTYGLKLVATSGAGLSEEAPRAGTRPEFRVQVDTIAPVIYIYQPEADPNNRDVLVLRWSVTDKNLGQDPITLEWSENPSGPWRSVVANDALIPVAAGKEFTNTQRIANSGRYAWKLPANMPSHMVYLKVTAWDAAGNKSEIATEKPILVDLTKPRARIQGIQPLSGPGQSR